MSTDFPGQPRGRGDTVTVETLRTSVMVTLSQITHGTPSCSHCEREAEVTIATGADPEPVPLCWAHGRPYVDLAMGLGDRFWKNKL